METSRESWATRSRESAHLSSATCIVATVQSATAGVWVQRVVVNPGSHFHIYLKQGGDGEHERGMVRDQLGRAAARMGLGVKAATQSVPAAWMVIERP